MAGFSRRRFLHSAGTAGLIGLMGCAGRKRGATSAGNARVVVLGGGFAGATAAKFLRALDPGVRVTLIERDKLYLSCVGSNQVVASLSRPKDLRHDYHALTRNRDIELVNAEVSGIDVRRHAVTLADGASVPYDRLIVAPGIDFRWDAIEGYDEAASLVVPHAWQAGPQTTLLRRQLRAMPNGGLVVIGVPGAPYRCPAAPYERASLIAHFLSQFKPRSKVLVLDAKSQFPTQALFQQAWRELYPGMVEWISAEKGGNIERVETNRRFVHTRSGRHRANVLNVIPPQRAGELVRGAGLVDASGWCPVDPRTFESSLAPEVHVIGDASVATPMPKTAFSANSQAKACAAAVLALLTDNEPALPTLLNTCYSFLSRDYAISATSVFGYSKTAKRLTAVSNGETPLTGDRRKEAELARRWHDRFMQEVFG